MPDLTVTVTIRCPRCGTDISEAAAIRKAVEAERARIKVAVVGLDRITTGAPLDGDGFQHGWVRQWAVLRIIEGET